jgi:hypothetical protein
MPRLRLNRKDTDGESIGWEDPIAAELAGLQAGFA